MSHIRQLSWLLLGSLTHCALHQGSTSCMPIPLDAGSQIADHLIVILIGFPEQSKVCTVNETVFMKSAQIGSTPYLICFLYLCVLFYLLRPQCCICALCSMPSCLHSFGLYTVSRLLPLLPFKTKT